MGRCTRRVGGDDRRAIAVFTTIHERVVLHMCSGFEDRGERKVINTFVALRGFQQLRVEASRGLVAGLWLELVCASWVQARRSVLGKPDWPAPLRDADHIWGRFPTSSKRLPNGLSALQVTRPSECVQRHAKSHEIWLDSIVAYEAHKALGTCRSAPVGSPRCPTSISLARLNKNDQNSRTLTDTSPSFI